MFLDGQLIDQSDLVYEVGSAATTAFFDDVSGLDSMTIGRNENSSGGRWHTNGLIDDVRLYSRALSSTEVSALATNVPVITNLGGDVLAYTEGDGAVVIDQAASALVTDIDSSNFNTGTLTVAFTAGNDNAEDVLAIVNEGTGAGQIGVSGANITYVGTTIGTFTGGSGGTNLVITLNDQANAAAVSALVQHVTYENTDTDAPTPGARTIRYVLTDGDGGTSANYDTTVTVSTANDVPVITNLGGDGLAYAEGDGAVVIDQGTSAVVTDVDSADFNAGTLTVSFTAGSDNTEDVLAIVNEGTGAGQIGVSGANITYAGTTIGTLTGGSGGTNLVITLNNSANAAAVSALVQHVTYENTDTDAPTPGARTIRYVLTDGDGGTSANYDTTVTVSTANDAPVITNLGGDGLAYAEGDGAVVIDQLTSALVTDVDSANFDTGTLTVSFTAGSDNAEDVLAIVNEGTGAGQIGVSGANVTYAGTTIGTFTGGSGGTNLVITLNNSANAAAVSALVQHVTYENTDTDAPTPGARTIRYVLTDGDGGTSANYDTTVTVSTANDVPVITNLGGDGLAYAEDDGAVVIDQGTNAVVTDVDSANFDTGTLTVSFTAGSDNAEDVLAIVNEGTGAGQIGVSGANIAYAGTTIGTFTGGSGGTNLVITLNNSANAAAVSALVQHVTYENTDTDAPTPGARTIRYVLTDGDGGTSANYDTTVTVSGQNDAPVNTVPGAQSVNKNTSLVIAGISVNDVDGNLSTVQLAVSNGTLNVTLSGAANISAGADDSADLTLSGTQTDINATLASLSYQGTLDYVGADTLTVTSTDSNVTTDIDTVGITVNSINVVPVNTVPGAQVVAEDTAINISGISVNDTDGDLSTVQLSVTQGTVTVTLSGAATISAGANSSNTLTLSGTQTDINATLASLDYQSNLNYNGADALTILSTDSNSATDSDTVGITVNAVNDDPLNTVPGAQSVNENTSLNISGISINDVDGDLSTVRLAVTHGVINVTLSGATIIAGANGTSTLTLSGTQTNINATLASLSYQGNLDFTGTDTLAIISTDTNAGMDSDAVSITVNSVTVAPDPTPDPDPEPAPDPTPDSEPTPNPIPGSGPDPTLVPAPIPDAIPTSDPSMTPTSTRAPESIQTPIPESNQTSDPNTNMPVGEVNKEIFLELTIDPNISWADPELKVNTNQVTIFNGERSVDLSGFISQDNDFIAPLLTDDYLLSLTPEEYEAVINNQDLWNQIERMHDDMQETFEEELMTKEFVANIATSTGLSLTTAALAWLMRSGTLLASMLSTIPAWKAVDPLSIVITNTKNGDKKKLVDEKDSKLESLDSADELFNQNNSDKLT